METKITSHNEQVVIRQLETTDARVLEACATGLRRGLLATVTLAQREFLSGPRPSRLQQISGRLVKGMNESVTVSGTNITGQIGNNVKYAAFHEFGFHGVVNVKAHTRALENMHAGGERDIRKKAVAKGGAFLGFLESRKRASGRQRTGFVTVQFVRAHQRKVNYAGKPFVRPALEQTAPVILSEINAELAKLK